MRITRLQKNMLLLLGLAGLLLGAAPGCIVPGRGLVVVGAPPPPRAVVVTARPGYVWIDGHWGWTGYDWAWEDGYWVAERPGYVYVQGYWAHDHGRRRWVAGTWRPARGHRTYGGTVVRDHRGGGSRAVQVRSRPATKAKANKSGGRVKVRDHRR